MEVLDQFFLLPERVLSMDRESFHQDLLSLSIGYNGLTSTGDYHDHHLIHAPFGAGGGSDGTGSGASSGNSLIFGDLQFTSIGKGTVMVERECFFRIQL
jgi:hypothetical protein